MQKIDMNSCFDDLAVQAGKGNPEAKEVLCRHFRKYIHNLSRSYQQGWDAEDEEQDLWVWRTGKKGKSISVTMH